jgi:calcium/calmodulin-dependent protein kinase I
VFVRLFETYDEGAEIYIVTELVAGGELFDRIVSKTSYTEKEARDLIKTLLETLAYMHGRGIVHRDLKPENLLLCSEEDDSNIKIADFGFAKNVKDLSSKETACGTPGYVAPEILRGDQYGTEVRMPCLNQRFLQQLCSLILLTHRWTYGVWVSFAMFC